MKRTLVSSSNIEHIGHSPEENLLEVKFKNGSTYHYHGVSKEAHELLLAANSHGSHLAEHIKKKFKFTKIS